MAYGLRMQFWEILDAAMKEAMVFRVQQIPSMQGFPLSKTEFQTYTIQDSIN